ncbi:MAG: hypothetical protein E7313_06890 [Clostridiales bacterium]|nr:hypothetical protein [Clostridiales bacterium]
MIKFAQAKNVGAVHTHTHTSISYLNNSVVEFATFMCVACQIVEIVVCKMTQKMNNKYNELE